jgi:hypothetical protein
MYSKEEAGKIKTAFWTAFGQYMLPVPSADEEKINWINYKTGVKHIRFKLEAESRSGFAAIVIDHPNEFERHEVYHQIKQLKNLFEHHTTLEWFWEKDVETGGRYISRISTSYSGYSIYNKEHWPFIISFFKQNLLTLDAFWCEVKYAFEK